MEKYEEKAFGEKFYPYDRSHNFLEDEINQNMKSQTIKYLGENIGGYSYDFKAGKDFLRLRKC